MTTLSPLFDTLEHLRDHDHIIKSIPENFHKEYQLTCEFLYSYRGSQATFSSYRREVERFLQWAWFMLKKPLADIKRHDFECYVEFCQQPPLNWIGTKQVARFKIKNATRTPNPDWRPFVVSISKQARSQGQTPDINRTLAAENK